MALAPGWLIPSGNFQRVDPQQSHTLSELQEFTHRYVFRHSLVPKRRHHPLAATTGQGGAVVFVDAAEDGVVKSIEELDLKLVRVGHRVIPFFVGQFFAFNQSRIAKVDSPLKPSQPIIAS